jgi:chaperone required for assembly of F1-ATPase
LTPSLAEPEKRWNGGVIVAPGNGGFALLLGGKPPRSPAGSALILPTAALAELVAEEWRMRPEPFQLAKMPLTRLAYAVLDRFPGERTQALAAIADHAGHDLLCYRAEAPKALRERQARAWTPLLDWAAAELGAGLAVANGIGSIAQPPHAVEALCGAAAAGGDFALAALTVLARLLGSAVLALAVWKGRLIGEAAFRLSRLDEDFQAEAWGVDPEAAAAALAARDEAIRLGAWLAAAG